MAPLIVHQFYIMQLHEVSSCGLQAFSVSWKQTLSNCSPCKADLKHFTCTEIPTAASSRALSGVCTLYSAVFCPWSLPVCTPPVTLIGHIHCFLVSSGLAFEHLELPETLTVTEIRPSSNLQAVQKRHLRLPGTLLSSDHKNSLVTELPVLQS